MSLKITSQCQLLYPGYFGLTFAPWEVIDNVTIQVSLVVSDLKDCNCGSPPHTSHNKVGRLLCVMRCSPPLHMSYSCSVSRQLMGTTMKTAERNTWLAARNSTSLMKTGRETKRRRRRKKKTEARRRVAQWLTDGFHISRKCEHNQSLAFKVVRGFLGSSLWTVI